MLTPAVRDTIGTGIYFVTYESIKQLLANARGESPTSPLAVVTAGGMCGLVSWACVRVLFVMAHAELTMCSDLPDRYRQEHLSAQLPRRRQRQAN